MILNGYIFALLYGVVCIGLSALCFKLGMKKSISRKLVHILVGFEWVILYSFHGVSLHFAAVCLIFTALLLVEYKTKLLPMMASEGDNAPGTVYYGVSMSLMAIASLVLDRFIFAFGIAVFVTSFGDGFAGVIGSLVKRCNPRIYKNKTLLGALSNLIFSFASVAVMSLIFDLKISVPSAILIAFFAVGLELIGQRGLDNIILPLGVSIFSYFIICAPEIAIGYFLPIVLTPYVIVLATGKDILTGLGVAAALLLDFVISVAFGNFGFLALLLFLLLSVAVDKIKKRARIRSDISEKEGRRDELQVLSNGLVAMFMALFFLVDGGAVFIVAYCASLTEALADTCASGFGVFSKGAFDIFKLKRVEKGMSGGMSVIGTLASLLASCALGLVPLAFGVLGLAEYLIVVLSAFLGAVFDSFLGSLVQAKYKCTVCGAMTERHTHCECRTESVGGASFITNDAVNLLSTLFSAVVSIVLFITVL